MIFWKDKYVSRLVVSNFVTSWTVAHQAPLSIGFSRQESWSGLPFPPPGDLPDPRIELMSPALQAGSLPSEQPGKHNFKRMVMINKRWNKIFHLIEWV